ncbi:MAG: hypothetical protein H6739_09900 [Alphaproteobacteria bacterium]|nr:hypothetical protein [Alphaproteobacteria bacterium]
MLPLLLALAACTDPDADTGAETAEPDPMADWVVGDGPLAPVSGRAFVFGPSGNLSLEGAAVFVVEAPEYATTAEADGTFALEVPSGRPLSFRVEQEGFTAIQSGTLPVGPEGVTQLGFQVPITGTTEMMAYASDIHLDEDRCQIATTISSASSPPYGGSGVGEPGATAILEPFPSEDAEGPIYFDFINDGFVLPDPTLTETTIDGGVLFGNVPQGEYTLRATHPTVRFTEVTIRCRAGVVVNASPPHGVEFLE